MVSIMTVFGRKNNLNFLSHYCDEIPKRKQDVFLTKLATSVYGKMANVRDSDTSLWLHNKLGTSNDSWISGSICSQLNKEVLRNIKECFPDLQTQVKLKLLLSFFHIPRRLVEEWKAELDEVIEVAGLDTELWVSMLAETMKTFPATSSLNTEISDYEDTRPIFTDMVNDLRKLVSKHCDLGMLPLECQYLNKNALISVVGQQQNPVKHFTLKRKPKSANLRTELLHKSADAQSSLKKASAPTIPLRSRGMPRKMTDTTPLKGIPSRVPTSGFRSPNVASNQQRPNLSRTPAGRKDGGIKLIEFTDQPLGYAAAKKRKRQQELEEQQKKQEQKQNAVAANNSSSPTASPTIASGVVASGHPTTPTTNNSSFEIKSEKPLNQLDDSIVDNKDEITIECTQIESSTADYKPTLTYTQQPASDSDNLDESKAHAKLLIAAANHSTAGGSKVSTISALPNNINTTPIKKIKQEIEIKSEEILVPATIKVEKIETQPSTLIHKTQLQQTVNQRMQQHVVIQQQPHQQQQQQTQHVVIRTTSQQQKQNVGSGITMTPTQRAPATIKLETIDIKPLAKPNNASDLVTQSATLTQQQLRQAANPLANLPNNISVKITSTKATKQQQQQQHKTQQQQPILINSSTPVILATSTHPIRKKQMTVANSSTSTPTTQSIKSMPLSQLKSATSSGPVIISQTIIQPAKRSAANNSGTLLQPSTVTSGLPQQNQQQHQHQQPQQPTQYILTSTTPQQHQQQQQNPTMPSLTSFAQVRSTQQSTLYQTTSTTTGASTQTPTKIVLKTTPASTVMMTPVRQQVSSIGNPPPLISTSSGTQQGTLLNIQNVQLPNRQVTIQPASHAAQQQHLQAQLQQQQQQNPQMQQQQHTVVSNTTTTQQPKLTQVVMQSAPNAGNVAANVKNKTIILTQKGVILRNIGGDMYQQIPISNVSGLQNIGTGTTLMTTAAGPPGLVKTTSSNVQPQQTIQIQQPTASSTLVKQQLPTLIPTNNLSTMTQQHVLVQQPQQQQTMQTIIGNSSHQTIIRPVMTNVQSGLTTLPQGLTLIQRPGQQPQLVQVQAAPSGQQQTQIHRTIITQPQQQQKISSLHQMRPQQIILQHKAPQQRIITTPSSTTSSVGGQVQQIQIQQNNSSLARGTQILQVQQQQQQQQQQPSQQQAPQRKGLSLSNEHVHKAHEMFRKANRVSRPDKALILGFMAGLRENPRPNPENVIVIKLGDSEEKVQQEDGSTALCLVESLIRLDYNTGEWKTFQNYRRIDQASQGQVVDSGTVMQTHNSVVI